MAKKQMAGDKRKAQCERIIGKPVSAAFMNGTFPHHVALAWTGPKDAYIVHLKNGKHVEYIRDGKFLLKRAFLPIKVWYPEESVPDTQVEIVDMDAPKPDKVDQLISALRSDIRLAAIDVLKDQQAQQMVDMTQESYRIADGMTPPPPEFCRRQSAWQDYT